MNNFWWCAIMLHIAPVTLPQNSKKTGSVMDYSEGKTY